MATGTTKDRLNLRAAPDTRAAVLQVLPPATQIEILENAGAWLKVKAPDSSVGYVAADFVTITADGGASPAAPAAATTATSTRMLGFTGDILNVRSSPGIQSNPDNKIETLSAGAQLTPLEDDNSLNSKIGTTNQQNQWIRVRTPSGKEGYVAAWLIQFAQPGSQPTGPTVTVSVTQPGQPQVTVTVSTGTTEPAAPPVSTPIATPAATPAATGPVSTFSGASVQPEVHNYIASIPDTYPIPQGYRDFWAQRDKLGLPDPFDVSPTRPGALLSNLPVNGFGPNSFSAANWQNYYKNVCGMHNGLDHIVPSGTPLVALSDGIIAGTQAVWPFMGNPNDKDLILWCFLPERYRDAQGRRMLSNVIVAYAHMSDNARVARRQVVKAGDVIGISGDPAGQVGNAHLHLEVHLLSGDKSTPRPGTRRLLGDFKRDQPFDNRTPFNPMLFFSEKLVKLHQHQGRKIGFAGGPTYPSTARLQQMGLSAWPPLDFFTLGSFQYGAPVIWSVTSLPWPNGIYDLTTLNQRIQNYTPFEPYPTDFI